MAWTNFNHQNFIFPSLSIGNGDTFTIKDDCLGILKEILKHLVSEDCTQRIFRRTIGYAQNIRKDLIPLLVNLRDDSPNEDAPQILDTAIKILINLTIPVEYLLNINSEIRVEENIVSDLNKLLVTTKEAFADIKSTKAVMDHMKFIVEKDSKLNMDQCESVNNCLLLLRNVLHIPEFKSASLSNIMPYSTLQNQIIWNLFTQSVDKVIIYLISCPQKMYFGVTMVQLIALLYKDQHVGTLQKLLNLWLETSLSESSEDNESNTSPPEQGSGESSPFITSDPTSDSSDTGGGNDVSILTNTNTPHSTSVRTKALSEIKRVQSTETEASSSSGISSAGKSQVSESSEPSKNSSGKRECPSSQSEVSDCGYGTQVEQQESISTSSNDDDHPQQKPIHQKPHNFQKTRYNVTKSRTATALEKKELRRKKLVKRSKTNMINMKGLMHHLPTDEDVSNILKEFTVDFLLKGYGTLVNDLHTQLLNNIHFNIDTSHFFWLVTYFLKFATQLELDLEHVNSVLSFEILSYLVFQGIWVYEELEIIVKVPNVDLKPQLRRLHLVVTALREFMQAVETYTKMIHLSDEDRDHLEDLQLHMAEINDLRALFILLLKQYNPNIQSKQYLQDLILTNHNYLLFLENTSKMTNQVSTISIMDHLKQFASVDIMKQYGLLLENFRENGEFVNNCIFTMMHHIGGDLSNIPTLFQPHILKTFSQIWETDYEICDDWSDLIEYVIHKFINTPRKNEFDSSIMDKNLNIVDSFSQQLSTEWSKEDQENLLLYYRQSENCPDLIENITHKYVRNGTRYKTKVSIVKELLKQNIINKCQYDDFMKCEKDSVDAKEVNKPMGNKEIIINTDSTIDKTVTILKDFLLTEEKGKAVTWLQQILLESCYAKIVLENSEEFKGSKKVVEPIINYFTVLNLPIPLISWTSEHNSILSYQPFVLLLHKLGFYLPVDTGKVFVRIPNFWTADYMYSLAQQLGPIDLTNLKFDAQILNGIKNQSAIKPLMNISVMPNGKFGSKDLIETPSIVRFTPLSSNQLNISIPNLILPYDSPTESANHRNSDHLAAEIPSLLLAMDCSPVNEDCERNSTCDTASVASDLTRMCVSDEEDKVILLIERQRL